VLYAAKAIVLGCVTLAVALVTSFASFFAGQAALASTHAGASITSPGALRAVLLTALFVTCYALLGFGLGAVIRHTAGAIAVLFGFLFIVPLVVNVLPEGAQRDALHWLPDNSLLNQIVAARPAGTADLFGPYGELAVFAGYAPASVTVAQAGRAPSRAGRSEMISAVLPVCPRAGNTRSRLFLCPSGVGSVVASAAIVT
jgi:hypothetical protein